MTPSLRNENIKNNTGKTTESIYLQKKRSNDRIGRMSAGYMKEPESNFITLLTVER
jgi:hypothetical protein